MKNVFLPVLIAGLLFACGGSETKQDNATGQSTADSMTVATPKARDCQSVGGTGKLGKSDVYQESDKAINVTLTVNQDTSTTQTTTDCFFNNVVTVLAAKKSGERVFRRVLAKDDLLYFIKNDEAVQRAVLQRATYKPTFNRQKYVTLTMHFMEPDTRKTTDYMVFMNYFGEIIRVK